MSDGKNIMASTPSLALPLQGGGDKAPSPLQRGRAERGGKWDGGNDCQAILELLISDEVQQ